MNSYKKGTNIVGWLVFAVLAVVMFASVERTGSLWDCGEFVAGCYKLQVVHPPGAPLFLMVGKLATVVGQAFSNDPSVIAFSVNMMSGICTALTATFICWTTIILAKIARACQCNILRRSWFFLTTYEGNFSQYNRCPAYKCRR